MGRIRAIISDVDGVMVGRREGVNFPLPHRDVITALQRISAAGTPIVLCTAKFGYAIKDIAIQAKLRNPHITDGGALIIDWLDNRVVAQHALDREVANAYVEACLAQDIYTEIYTADTYYVQKSQAEQFTAKRTKLLQAEPIIATSLSEVVEHQAIIKVVNFSKGKDDQPAMESNTRRFGDRLTYIWSQHPYLVPRRGMIITAPGVSKQHASIEVAKCLGVPFDSILGIGDSESDWNFMQLCAYVATIGEDSVALQQLAESKDKAHRYFASTVDDHGIIEIFRHFDLC
jgi:hydroxymethylpyrimidine pyrophosphatase-like HAD family hydrolase